MMKLNLLTKNLSVFLSAIFFALGIVAVNAQTISNIQLIQASVCAGGTLDITFDASNGNGNPTGYSRSTIFQVNFSVSPGGASAGSATFTNVQDLPATFVNKASYSGVRAQITLPSTLVVGQTYTISLGSTTPNTNAVASNKTFIVNAPAVGGSISPSSNTICSGGNSGQLTLTGNTGTVLRWEKSTTADVWTTATNTNQTNTFTSGAITQNTQYRAVVQNGNCVAYSSITTITVQTPLTISSEPQAPASYCLNSTATPLSVTANGSGLTYQWYKSSSSTLPGDPVGTNLSTYTPSTTSAGANYFYVVVSNVCGSVTSSRVPVTVNPDVIAGTITPGSSSICAGTTTMVTSNGTPGGVWSSNNTAIATVNSSTGLVTGVSAGTATIIYTVSGCGGPKSVSAQVTVTPATAITKQPTSTGSFCANSSATALTVEATGTGTLSYQWYSSTGGTNGEAISGATAASYTPSTTIEGTQYYYVTVTGCNTVTSSVVTVKVGAQNTWNGSSWSAGTSNMPGYNAVIDADYNTTAGNIVACNCTVNSGKTLTIGAGTHMTVENKVVNNGSLIVESDGNLLQKDPTVVNGTPITVKRNFTLTELRKEYNFISSPVKGQNMKLIFGSATAIPYVTVYNEATDYFVNAKDADYNIEGRGFSVKEPTKLAVPLNNATAVYNGFPNNGSYSVTLPYSGQYYGFNVVGNPYPSNIDIDLLTAANSDNIESTIRFWDNTVNRTYSQQGSNYNQSAYATYNPSTGAVPAPGYDVGTASSKMPSNIVKVDQAFMIQAKKAGAITFNNNMRVTTNGSVFFGKEVGRDAFHLEMVTPTGKGMQNAFAYVPEIGSVKFGEEDSETYNYYASDALYSILDDTNVIIDGRGAFSADDVIKLGTSHFGKGLHTIRALDLQGIFANGQPIYLKDNVTKIITDISKKSYTFEAVEGESNNRFEILYRTESLGTDNVVKSGLVVYKEGSSFIVRGGKKMRSVELYDAVGRLVKALPTNSDTIEIAAESMTPGIYVVKVKYDDGTTQTKKVLK